jgi:hypothetical protein
MSLHDPSGPYVGNFFTKVIPVSTCIVQMIISGLHQSNEKHRQLRQTSECYIDIE